MTSPDGSEVGFTSARFGGRARGRGDDGPGPRDAGEADTLSMAALDTGTGAEPAADPGEPLVGPTGARFGGPSRRRRPVDPRQVDPPPDPPPDPIEPVGAPVAQPAPGRGSVRWREPGPDPAGTSFVRPYVLTRGRTRSTFELAIEALVSVVPDAPGGPTQHPDILELCRAPRSVAEIAALRGIPIGVARVLLGDLVAAGAVVVHRTVDAGGPDVALMERVLSGLRRL